MPHVIDFGLAIDIDWCATCLIIQKSAWLEKHKEEISKPVKELVRLYGSIDPDLPCEIAVTTGPSTILAGPNSVCMTHLLNNNPMQPPGKTLQLGSAGDMRIRGSNR